jgi:hypothetical protein
LLQARWGSVTAKMGSMDAHCRWIIHGWLSWSDAGVEGS